MSPAPVASAKRFSPGSACPTLCWRTGQALGGEGLQHPLHNVVTFDEAVEQGRADMAENQEQGDPGQGRVKLTEAGCPGDLRASRSEERRVGKECRSRWSV